MNAKIDDITRYLLEEINCGNLPTGSKVPSEYSLADKFNVHKSTANKAVSMLVARNILTRLKGKAGTVVANSFIFPKGRIAVVTHPCLFGYYQKIVEGVFWSAWNNSYAVEFINIDHGGNYVELWKKIGRMGVDGIVSTTGKLPGKASELPQICVDHIPEEQSCNYVISDDYKGGRCVAEHLIANCHREIVFVGLAYNFEEHIKLRIKGFMDVLDENGISGKDRFFQTNAATTSVHSLIDELIGKFPRTTAIAFRTDFDAYGGAMQLLQYGRKIPRDISITGYGALPEFRTFDFIIDSVDQSPFRMGNIAADNLIDIIEGRKSFCQTIMPVRMVPGNTTACLSAPPTQ